MRVGEIRLPAALWTAATALGSTDAAHELITHLRQVSPSDSTRAGQWAVGHANLDKLGAADLLLDELREAGASDAVATLLAHDPAGHANLDNPGAISLLLRALGWAGASNAVTALATRAANAGMFDIFLEVRPDEASSYLLGREPDGAPSQPWKWQEPTG